MTVGEFLAQFPEVPADLRDEPVLGEYVSVFGPLLRLAQKPTPCMRDGGDVEHMFYTRLVNDLAIYGIGLAKRDKTLARLGATLAQYEPSQPPLAAPWCHERHQARLAPAALKNPLPGLSGRESG